MVLDVLRNMQHASLTCIAPLWGGGGDRFGRGGNNRLNNRFGGSYNGFG